MAGHLRGSRARVVRACRPAQRVRMARQEPAHPRALLALGGPPPEPVNRGINLFRGSLARSDDIFPIRVNYCPKLFTASQIIVIMVYCPSGDPSGICSGGSPEKNTVQYTVLLFVC